MSSTKLSSRNCIHAPKFELKRKPASGKSLLFHAWLGEIADAAGEDGHQTLLFGIGKSHLVILHIDGLQLTLQDIVGYRTPRGHPWRGERRHRLVAAPAAEGLGLDNALSIGGIAGIRKIGGLRTDNLGHL